jgi:hypothetical protein
MARGDDVLRAIDQSRTLRTKSSLEAWMTDHHDAFADRLKGRIADWAVLCALFKEAELTDRSGRTPKPETARKTWQRVRQRVAEARAKGATKPTVHRSAPVEATPAPPLTKPATAAAGSHDDIRAMLSTGRKLPDPI